MNGLTTFFHFCAGANDSILRRSPTDRHKYAGIGATVFFTGVFAAVAGGFALHSVFKSVPIAVTFGVMWGLMIFNLDRYIVMSIKKKDKPWKEMGMALPRLCLAVLIAFVIAKPLELKLFQSEIRSELVMMEQERYREQEEVLRSRYMPEIERLGGEIKDLNTIIEEKRASRDQLSRAAIQEADGTGGSGIRNLGPIYAAKKRDADNAQSELDKTIMELSPDIANRKTERLAIEADLQTALNDLEQTDLDGFAAQMDALGRLGERSSTIFWASIFITLLFMAIETAPLFVKLMSDRSPYDYRLDQHEAMVRNSYRRAVETVQTDTENALHYHKTTSRAATLEAIAAEKEVITGVISSELDSIRQKSLSWKAYKKEGRVFL